ncbi:MAG: autotransporter domain-containing protein [Verrucomicrobia bacterium]|nr:autotransporter domain-containing protein [Verrucomicrobiota bacterium]
MPLRKLSALTLFTLTAAMMHAANLTWSGAVNNLWTNPGNWVGGVAPNNGDSLLFPGNATSFTSTNDTGTIQIASITIDSATAYTISGQSNTNFIVMQAPTPSITINPTVGTNIAHNISAMIQLGANLAVNQPIIIGGQISGAISENSPGLSVTYTGPQVFVLSGPNTYTGGTIISADSLLNGTTQSIPDAGGATIGMGGFLIFEQNFSDTYSGPITGAGRLLVTSPGSTTQSITLSNSGNNYAGITDIDVGTTLIGTTSTIPSNLGVQFFGSGAFLNFNQLFAGAYTAPITGGGSVVISGNRFCNVTLSNAGNTYSGGTTITTGTLSVSADANMGALTAPVNLGSASTDLPVLQALATFATGRPITVNATQSTIDPNGFTLTHNTSNGGAATGAGGLMIGQAGGAPGTFVLQAPYSYTGGTILASGQLTLSGPSASLPGPGPAPRGDLILQDAANIFDMSDPTLASNTVTIGNLLGEAGAQVLLGSNTLVVTSSAFNTFASTISGLGQVIKTGPATWDIQGTNTYTGGTQVNQGILEITGAGVMAPGPVSIAAGATFDIGGAAAAQTIGNLSGAGTLALEANNLFHNPTSDTNFSGQITSDGSSVFTQNANHTLTLSGSSNNLLGNVTIAQGSIQAGIANIFPNINLLTIAGGASFNLNGFNQTIGNLSGSGNTLLGANTLTVTISADTTYNGNISGAGGQIIKNGSSTWTLGSGNSYTGGTTVNNGTIKLGTDNAIPNASLTINSPGVVELDNFLQTLAVLMGDGSITMGDAILEINSNTTDSSFSGSITGPSGQVVKEGIATLTLSGKNTFADGLLVDQGTVKLGADNAISPQCPVDLMAGTTFDISATSFQSVEAVNENGNVILGAAQLTVNPIVNSFYGYVAGVPGIMSGTGSLVLAGPSNYTLQSNNTFSGGTTVNGGTLILSPFNGANALLPTGNVTVNSPGSLDISGGVSQTVGALTGNGNVTVEAGALLTVQPVAPTTFSGSISGQGAVTVGGSSTFILQGPNTFTGGTTLADTVTLQLSTAAALLPGPGVSPSGDILLGAGTTFDMSSTGVSPQSVGNFSGSGNSLLGANTLTVTITNPETYNGTFSGSGGKIIKSGAATWTLGGISSFAGELHVEQGTVQPTATDIMPNLGLLHISSGATFDLNMFDQKMGDLEGGGTLNLTDNKFSNHSQSDRTFSGVIQGSNLSRFNHHGKHILTLSGVSTTTGDFEIVEGTVKVDAGAVVPAHFTVDASGRLRGKGTVASVQNFGRVEPGASIGTLFINPGPYNEAGTLQIEVNDLGQASSIDVTGNINISGGTTLKLVPDLGSYTNPITYTVATFTGTRTGTYSNVVTSLANRFNVSVIYNPNDIQVALGVTPFSIIITGGNAGAASHCIESIPHGHGTDGLVVINSLEVLSDDLMALRDAFNQLQPSQYAALALAQENNDILIRSALTQRSFYRCAKEETTENRQQASPVEETTRKGSLWFEPLGKYAHQNHQQQNIGYHAATGGALLGADYQILNSLFMGGAVGYTFTGLDWLRSAGKADIRSYYGALYGAWSCERVFVDASIIGAYNHYDASRFIHFPGIHRRANNEHNGYQIAESLGTGLYFHPWAFDVEPFARADYIFLHQSGFTEHGAKSVDLQVESADSRYIRTDLGVKASRCFKTSKVKYIPYFKMSWVWEKQLDGAHFESSFKATSCTFKVTGLRPVRSLIAPSLGISLLTFDDAFSFEFHDDVEVGKNFWENRAYLNFSYRY